METIVLPRPELAGHAPGINVSPGAEDDGWVTPPPVELSDGTRVFLYKDGEALKAAYGAMAAAQRRIALEVYIFHSDETGNAFADLLCRKAREGLTVHVIYDSFGCLHTEKAMFQRMRDCGVRLATFDPVWPWDCQYRWRPFNRDHRKLLLIDDDLAGLGGLNIGDEYAGPWVVPGKPLEKCPWRDNAIGLKGPATKALAAAFTHTWRYVHRGGPMQGAQFIHQLYEGDFGVLASAPTLNSPLVPLLTKVLREAQSSILLTMSYFAPPDGLINELCRAARRGVRVRLMLPGICDHPLLLVAARSFYEKLLASGVEIHEREGAVMHSKTMCIDGRVGVIGSTNLDNRSIEYNLELSAFLRSKEFGKQLHDLFENDVRWSRQITSNAWRRRPRPVWDRFVQWAVDRVRYLL